LGHVLAAVEVEGAGVGRWTPARICMGVFAPAVFADERVDFAAADVGSTPFRAWTPRNRLWIQDEQRLVRQPSRIFLKQLGAPADRSGSAT
jgi:hypothetical protein